MTSTISTSSALPSGRTLAVTTVVAAAVAAILLFGAVLPAEYGVDPIGTGRLLGLTAMSQAPVLPASSPTPASTGAAITFQADGPVVHASTPFAADMVELRLSPYQFVEYKYRLEKGATMLYAWKATAMPKYDFHADPDGTPAPPPVSFDRTPKLEAHGTLTAPFSGIHGWYWENMGGDPMTITLRTAGFYSGATEFRSPRIRRPHQPTPIDQLLFPTPAEATPRPAR